MATFRFSRAINLHWQGYEIKGPALTVFSIPDQLYEEFNADIAPVEPSLAWIDTNEFLTLQNSVQVGGVTSVSGTSPITTSGTTAITVAVIDASTTSAGVVILSDSTSTTSSVLAATPTAVKSAYDRGSTGVTNAATAQAKADTSVQVDVLSYVLYGSSSIIATIPKGLITTLSSGLSGVIYFSLISPHRTFTVTNLSYTSGTTAATALTLCRFGIYTRSGTTFTLVARTASDTSIFAAISTKYTRALDTAGGYPATYTMTAGTEYYIAVIQVGTGGASTLQGANRQGTAAGVATGYPYYTTASQSDLAATATGVVGATTNAQYAEVS